MLTKVFVFLVGWGVARLTNLTALGGAASLPCARGPGAIHVVLAGRDGVGSAAYMGVIETTGNQAFFGPEVPSSRRKAPIAAKKRAIH